MRREAAAAAAVELASGVCGALEAVCRLEEPRTDTVSWSLAAVGRAGAGASERRVPVRFRP